MAHGVASRYDSFIELDALQNQIDSAINRSNHLLREMGVLWLYSHNLEIIGDILLVR